VRSLLGGLVTNRAPIPQTGRSSAFMGGLRKDPRTRLSQIEAMGAVGTLFSVVDLTSTATAAVKWHLMQEAASGIEEDRTEIPVHPALSVWRKPNDFFSTKRLVATVQQHVDLAGIGFLVVARDGRFNLPIELWPARPDRIKPVPDPETFIAGYVYTSPDGEQVPLEVEDVLPIIMPDPADIYGGMSAVPSLMTDLGVIGESAAWSLNFFRNGAAPGGVIQTPNELDDGQFRTFVERWREQHQGVSNAHRVALLENGMQWVDHHQTMRDMQFTELRTVSSAMIQEAYRVHDHMLGKSKDVNRANADAAGDDFARYLTVPRVDRWQELLQDRLLPLFGKNEAKGKIWTYDSPVTEDEEVRAKILLTRAQAAVALKSAGYDSDDVLTACELPAMTWTEPPTPIAPPAFGEPDEEPDEEDETTNAVPFAPWMTEHGRDLVREHVAHVPSFEPAWASASLFRAASGAPEEVDVTPMAEAHAEELAALIERWAVITDAQRETLVRQVREIVESGEYERLTALAVDSAAGAEVLREFMTRVAQTAGGQVVAEAAAQDVAIMAVMPSAQEIALVATMTAAMLAGGLALSAGYEAARVLSPDISAREVGEAVADQLRSLTDAQPRKQLGGALHGAMNAGRIATFKAGPIAALYANEQNDKNTCGPCKAVNGRWLGNSNNGTDLEQVEKTYPTSGYIDCLGGVNCRGTVTGVWRSKTAGES